jgi:hypothetical protein
MAGHPLIEAHLSALGRRLPAGVVDELADGLWETWQRHLDNGLSPEKAAGAAVAEFGTVHEITAAFVAQAPGRRAALLLLATGPVVGACWGTALATAHAWTWPVPAPVAVVTGLAFVAVLACLGIAATSRHSYRRTRVGTVGALGLAGLDATVLIIFAVASPTLAWPLLAAVPLSLGRIALVVTRLPAVLTR